jgi:hypothetical protein
MELEKSEFKIDSLKLRILKSELKKITLPYNLNAKIISIYADSGEIIDTNQQGIKDKLNTLKLSNDNNVTALSIAIESIRTSLIQREYITLKITSKLLKERYYQGINLQTINNVKEYLNSVGIGITIEQLLKSEVTDIDICKDFTLSNNEYNLLINQIKKNTKASQEQNKGYNIFNQKDNKGIEFSSRKKATPTNPFFKIYNKFLDSKSKKHSQYFENYKIETETNLHRIELTLKNKKHFEKYNLNNTLESFLSLSQKKLNQIVSSITSIHLNKISTNKMELRKQQNIYESYIELCLLYSNKLNIPYEETKVTLLNAISNRTTKINHNNMFDKVNLELESNCQPYKENSKIQIIMKELCLL